MTTHADARARAEAAGQGHVFRFWNDLDGPARERLGAEVAALDFDQIAELGALLSAPPAAEAQRELAPPELFRLEQHASEQGDEARARGAELLGKGQVGYVLVAGGQASRLGYDGPKGAFPVGPVSGDPLFAFHARRLAAASARHGCRTPWAIMTSPANDATTKAFFAEHEHFGLDPSDVHFFQQEMLPALDDDGRILMSARDRIFLAPNGHGGVLWGLARSGLLAKLRDAGVTQLSYFQVDNPLARPADPLFLGLHAAAGAGMSSKVVKKRDAGEKVGVLGKVDGRMGCIEYSDLPEDQREQRDADGELTFRAGNIAVHAIRREFVEELTKDKLELPWHLARKKMKVVDDAGEPVEAFGTKFETFVFDALGRSTKSVTLEVDRAIEFSPVKNAEGEDSPATCRRDLCKMFAGWAAAAGRALPEVDADGVHPVEVDPRVAESREEFVAAAPTPKPTERGHLYR